MHILYFHQHFSTPKGSTGTRSYEMAQKLLENGHQVTMVCGSFQVGKTGLEGEVVDGIRRGNVDGIDVVQLELPYSNHDGFLKRSMTFLKFGLKSIKIAYDTDYDLLFATSTPLTVGIPGILMKVFPKRKKPFIFEVRDLWPELPKEMGVITNPVVLFCLDALEWASYHAADHCIALSPGIAKGIEKRGIPAERISMIPNGCDLELFEPTEPSEKIDLPGIEKDDFVAIFTGAHGMANGLDALLDAAAELKRRNVTNIKLVMIGDGKLKPALQERASKEGLDNCLFFDKVPKIELAKIVSRADVGLMLLKNCPAFYYGTSPNKFFDYISSAIPVLNNYPGWLADLITEFRCGKVVPPENPAAFADALIELANDPNRSEMGERSRELAKERFNRKDLATKFTAVLERFLPSF